MRLFIIISLLSSAAEVLTECPDFDELPIVHPDYDDLFECGRFYQGPGDDDLVQACNTCDDLGYYDMPSGDEYPGEDGMYIPMGSIMVMAGCKFYGFDGINYEGHVSEYDGETIDGLIHADAYSDDVCGERVEGFRSFKCRCEQEFINCDDSGGPYDALEPVMVCNNSQGETDVTCTYSETTGTSYTTSATESMSYSHGVETAIQSGFKDYFSVEVGYSYTTGYDWTTSETETFAEAKTVEVSAEIPAGTSVNITQARGYCDGNTAYPNYFLFTPLVSNREDWKVGESRPYRRNRNGELEEVKASITEQKKVEKTKGKKQMEHSIPKMARAAKGHLEG